MNQIERIATDLVAQYVEQIRPFTDRIAQLEASNQRLIERDRKYSELLTKCREDNEKLKEAIRLLRRGLREEADKVLEE
jgi:uncharacterized phage infection (PIP) family protein YhgE